MILLHWGKKKMPHPPRSAPLPVGTGRRAGGSSRPVVGSSGSYGLMSQSYMDVAAVAPEQVKGAALCDPPHLASHDHAPRLSLSHKHPKPDHAQPVISPRYQGGEEEEEKEAGVATASHGGADGKAAADDGSTAALLAATGALNLSPGPAASPPPLPAPRAPRMPPLGAARQCHENEVAEVVIVCEPEGTSLMMGGLHPR